MSIRDTPGKKLNIDREGTLPSHPGEPFPTIAVKRENRVSIEFHVGRPEPRSPIPAGAFTSSGGREGSENSTTRGGLWPTNCYLNYRRDQRD